MLKPLTINDREIIEPYLKKANFEGYNSNFMTMMMWNHEYNIHYYCNERFLVLLSHYEHLLFWNMPYAEKEDYQEAIEFMRDYCAKTKIPFLMDGVLNEQVEWIKEIYGDDFQYVSKRGEYDYIYEKEKLISLSGKKMQKRRNHFNAFLKLYDGRYTYKRLEREDYNQVVELMSLWENNKDEAESIRQEHEGILFLLDHMDQLDYKGGCIYIDGKLEAFAIASELNHKTIQIHVEKANTEFRGLFVAISKFFLENEFEDCLYVNREDDMELESLRYSKTQLRPLKLLEKSFVFPNNYKIRKATDCDYGVIKQMWINNFKEDSIQYVNFHFEHIYDINNTYALEIDHMIICVLQMVPLEIMFKGKVETISFVVGVATNPMFRQLGYMRKLLNYALEDRKDEVITVLQAYNWDVYKSFGFDIKYYKKKVIINDLSKIEENQHIQFFNEAFDYKDLVKVYNQYVADKDGYRVRDENYYQKYLLESYEIDSISLKVAYNQDNEIVGYIAYSQDIENENQLYVSEAIYTSKDVLLQLLKQIQTNSQVITVLLSSFDNIGDTYEEEIVPFMMVKENTEIFDLERPFISENL